MKIENHTETAKFKRMKLFDGKIVIYTCEYQGKKYRIVSRTDKGGKYWQLMQYDNDAKLYNDTNWSSAGSISSFISNITKRIEDNNL